MLNTMDILAIKGSKFKVQSLRFKAQGSRFVIIWDLQ